MRSWRVTGRAACVAAILVAVASSVAHGDWPSDSSANLPVCTDGAEQNRPTAISNGAGGAYFVWLDARNGAGFQVFAQQITSSGTLASGWPVNGKAASAGSGVHYNPAPAADGFGGLVVGWSDSRADSFGIYAQRFAADGSLLWRPKGTVVSLFAHSDTNAPKCASDNAGGAYLAWDAYPVLNAPFYVYVNRIDGSGSLPWGAAGIRMSMPDAVEPEISSDGSGGAVVAWEDRSNGVSVGISAGRLSGAGTSMWAVGGVPVCSAAGDRTFPQVITDASGGAFITWTDYRADPLDDNPDVYLAHVLSTGVVDPGWPTDGLAVSASAIRGELNPQLVPDGQGGAIVVWQDTRFGGSLFAQRVTAGGTFLWGTGSLVSQPAPIGVPAFRIAPDGSAGVICAWPGPGQPSAALDLFSQHLSSAGVQMWSAAGLKLSIAPGVQSHPSVVSDSAGGAIVAWQDTRTDAGDIYAQNVHGDGSLGGQIVAAVLALVSADLRDGIVHLEWFSPDRAQGQFSVERTIDTGPSQVLASVAGDGTGHIRYQDGDVLPGHRYGYRLAGSVGGDPVATDLAWIDVPASDALALERPFPNPSAGSMSVSFALRQASHVRLDVVDAGGRLIRRLLEQDLSAGAHSATWNGRTLADLPVPSGLYFMRLESGGRILSRRIAEIR